jgi:hypothetical protein
MSADDALQHEHLGKLGAATLASTTSFHASIHTLVAVGVWGLGLRVEG